MKKKREIHPAIFELKDDFEKGKLTRREFIRYAALLGMSVSMVTVGLRQGRERASSTRR